MAEDYKQTNENKFEESSKKKEKAEIVEAKSETKKQEIKQENKPEEKKEETKKKVVEVSKIKKTEALVKGLNLSISTKQSIAICNFIRNKNIEKAILELEDAAKMKIAIPMRGEIPHKKGIMSGRYPVKSIKEFIRLLKSLKSNAIANELELEKVKIACMANVAARPYRRFGRKRFKRTNVEVKLIPIVKKVKSGEKKK